MKTSKTRKLSIQQMNYVSARALLEVRAKANREYGEAMDAEGEKLGLETPYCILPEGHPMWVKAQELLDAENSAKKSHVSGCLRSVSLGN